MDGPPRSSGDFGRPENFYRLEISCFQFQNTRGTRVAKDTDAMKTPLLTFLLLLGAALPPPMLAGESAPQAKSAPPPDQKTSPINLPNSTATKASVAHQRPPLPAKPNATAPKDRGTRAARPAFLFM